jgi:hypothetical protein
MLPSTSMNFRKSKNFLGLVANSLRCSGVTGRDKLNFAKFGNSELTIKLLWIQSESDHRICMGIRFQFKQEETSKNIRSPKGFEIQVLLLMKQVILTPSSFWRLGTIWIALDPFPMTPTLLFLKSYLYRLALVQAKKAEN